MPLHPAQCWHSVEDFPEAQMSRCYTYQVQMPQASPPMKAWELYTGLLYVCILLAILTPAGSCVPPEFSQFFTLFKQGRPLLRPPSL